MKENMSTVQALIYFCSCTFRGLPLLLAHLAYHTHSHAISILGIHIHSHTRHPHTLQSQWRRTQSFTEMILGAIREQISPIMMSYIKLKGFVNIEYRKYQRICKRYLRGELEDLWDESDWVLGSRKRTA